VHQADPDRAVLRGSSPARIPHLGLRRRVLLRQKCLRISRRRARSCRLHWVIPVPLRLLRLDRRGQRVPAGLAVRRVAVKARPAAKRPARPVAPRRLGSAGPAARRGALTRTLRPTAQRRPVPPRWQRRGRGARRLRLLVVSRLQQRCFPLLRASPVPLPRSRLDRRGQRAPARLAVRRVAVKARPAAKRPARPVAPRRLGSAGLGAHRGALTRTLTSTAQRRPVPPR
jgi:hypothetical protein